jgi:hypothetical protein
VHAHFHGGGEKDPTVMIGGTLPLLHSGYRVGHGAIPSFWSPANTATAFL